MHIKGPSGFIILDIAALDEILAEEFSEPLSVLLDKKKKADRPPTREPVSLSPEKVRKPGRNRGKRDR